MGLHVSARSKDACHSAHLADAALAVGVQDELGQVAGQVHQRHVVAAAECQALQFPQAAQTARQACDTKSLQRSGPCWQCAGL